MTLYRQGVIIYSYLISLTCIRAQGVNSTPIGGMCRCRFTCEENRSDETVS